MKKYILIATLLSSYAFSQTINDYKYAVVPAKFIFFKESNKYNLNVLTKVFFTEFGFETYLDSEKMPSAIVNQNCSKVFVDVLENNSMFLTKITVVLKDCQNKILFTSAEGRSKEKEYKVAYNEALRMALKSFDKSIYKYNGKQEQLVQNITTVEKSDEKIVDTNVKIAEKLSIENITNGYLVIDSESSTVVLKLLKTADPNLFIAQSKLKNGLVSKKENQYIFEYYENNKLVSEILMIKL